MIGVRTKHSGFTLVELSIVLIVVGLLLGTAITALTSFLSRAQFSETQARLALIQEALMGYVISRGRLPCPDVNDYPPVAPTFGTGSNGIGDLDGGGACIQEIGYLPYTELGLPARDVWGSVYYYAVDNAYADNPPPGQAVTFTLTETEGDIDVRDSAGGNLIADNIVALFYSVGPNAHINAADASDDEDENLDVDSIYVNKNYVPAGAAQPEFDDVLKWVSSYTLKAKMTEAQRLPE